MTVKPADLVAKLNDLFSCILDNVCTSLQCRFQCLNVGLGSFKAQIGFVGLTIRLLRLGVGRLQCFKMVGAISLWSKVVFLGADLVADGVQAL